MNVTCVAIFPYVTFPTNQHCSILPISIVSFQRKALRRKTRSIATPSYNQKIKQAYYIFPSLIPKNSYIITPRFIHIYTTQLHSTSPHTLFSSPNSLTKYIWRYMHACKLSNFQDQQTHLPYHPKPSDPILSSPPLPLHLRQLNKRSSQSIHTPGLKPPSKPTQSINFFLFTN